MTTSNAFFYGLTQSIGDTAITYALTAARWGVLGAEWYYDTFFSANAQRRYEWAGQMVACLGLLAYLYGRKVRGYAQRWVDAQVAAAEPAEAMPAPEVVQPTPEVEADPFSPEVNPLPVAIAPLEGMTIRQLKAAARGKVPGYGRMTSQQLREALRAA